MARFALSILVAVCVVLALSSAASQVEAGWMEVRVSGSSNMLQVAASNSSSTKSWRYICYYTSSGGSYSNSAISANTRNILGKLMGFTSASLGTYGSRYSSSYKYGYRGITCPTGAISFSQCTLGDYGSCPSGSRYSSSSYVATLRLSSPAQGTVLGSGGVYVSPPTVMMRQTSSGVFQKRDLFSDKWTNVVGNVQNILSTSGETKSSSCGGSSTSSRFDVKVPLALCVALGYDVRYVKTLKVPSSASSDSPGLAIAYCTKNAAYSSSGSYQSTALSAASCSYSTSSLSGCSSSGNAIAADCDAQTKKVPVALGSGWDGWMDTSRRLWVRPSGTSSASVSSWGTFCPNSTQANADALCGAFGWRVSTGYYSRLSTSSGASSTTTRYFTNLNCPASSKSRTVTSLESCKLTKMSLLGSQTCTSGSSSYSSRYMPVLYCGDYTSSTSSSGRSSRSSSNMGSVPIGAIVGPVVAIIVGLVVFSIVFSVFRARSRMNNNYGNATAMDTSSGMTSFGSSSPGTSNNVQFTQFNNPSSYDPNASTGGVAGASPMMPSYGQPQQQMGASPIMPMGGGMYGQPQPQMGGSGIGGIPTAGQDNGGWTSSVGTGDNIPPPPGGYPPANAYAGGVTYGQPPGFGGAPGGFGGQPGYQ